LQHCIEKGNYYDLIKNACTGSNGSVYCGKSAGAIVAGKSIETATWKGWDDPSVVPGKERYEQWIGCNGFGFAADKSFFPHYSSDWEDLVKKKTASERMKDKTVVLNEDTVYSIIGADSKSYLLGTMPAKI
jgi:peptidase E